MILDTIAKPQKFFWLGIAHVDLLQENTCKD
jgi:hypothetical protein